MARFSPTVNQPIQKNEPNGPQFQPILRQRVNGSKPREPRGRADRPDDNGGAPAPAHITGHRHERLHTRAAVLGDGALAASAAGRHTCAAPSARSPPAARPASSVRSCQRRGRISMPALWRTCCQCSWWHPRLAAAAVAVQDVLLRRSPVKVRKVRFGRAVASRPAQGRRAAVGWGG